MAWLWLQVCATCVGAGDARLAALRFQHVLVDECTQASEPEALIPLVLGAKQVSILPDVTGQLVSIAAQGLLTRLLIVLHDAAHAYALLHPQLLVAIVLLCRLSLLVITASYPLSSCASVQLRQGCARACLSA